MAAASSHQARAEDLALGVLKFENISCKDVPDEEAGEFYANEQVIGWQGSDSSTKIQHSVSSVKRAEWLEGQLRVACEQEDGSETVLRLVGFAGDDYEHLWQYFEKKCGVYIKRHKRKSMIEGQEFDAAMSIISQAADWVDEATSFVQKRAREADLMQKVEVVRNALDEIIGGDKLDLSRVFSADGCARIGRLRLVVETVNLEVYDKDPRWQDLLNKADSIEGVLREMGTYRAWTAPADSAMAKRQLLYNAKSFDMHAKQLEAPESGAAPVVEEAEALSEVQCIDDPLRAALRGSQHEGAGAGEAPPAPDPEPQPPQSTVEPQQGVEEPVEACPPVLAQPTQAVATSHPLARASLIKEGDKAKVPEPPQEEVEPVALISSPLPHPLAAPSTKPKTEATKPSSRDVLHPLSGASSAAPSLASARKSGVAVQQPQAMGMPEDVLRAERPARAGAALEPGLTLDSTAATPAEARDVPYDGLRNPTWRYEASLQEGWIWKRSRVLKRWRRRYLVLTRNSLAAYKQPGDRVPTERIDKSDVYTTFASDSEIQLSRSFCVRTLAGRNFYMVCDDEVQKQVWMSTINKAFGNSRR